MKTREELHIDLVNKYKAWFYDTRGSQPIKSEVYYQPPSNFRMVYPCIRYSLDNTFDRYADNGRYNNYNRFTITIIDKDPDSILYKYILEMPYTSFNRVYQADNLYHYVITIYY